jgi:hypothetical protein
MIMSKSIILADSQERWRSALQEAEKCGICGLALSTTGPDPLCHEIRLICLALPNNCVYVADRLALGECIISDLAGLIENAKNQTARGHPILKGWGMLRAARFV